ncbi:MAG TPA: amidohydrolase family protein [Thermoanaerobaculia bacterium]|nr:amidohydrolase family protein [Thermoanaerobaculia bacterium]
MRRSTTILALALLVTFALALPSPAFAHGPGEVDVYGVQQPEEGEHADEMSDEEEAEAEADESESEEEDEWDVNDPPGPSSEVEIDVREGTWMHVDVSPDGGEIVFDLLGDLYTIPITGGEATALTSGVAWDMQPRYSPDGSRIAFTSDRSGGDNVWVMNRDGSDPVQVSDESYRLLNSPTWAPDGEFIAARKHFTSRRSAGAGEIWLYHRTGTGGLQMTERPNDQKDVGEPAFSPDGRYLYFSQDTTPGDFFEYNKDPNPGIYTIRRLDRETGEIDDWIDGAGGAIRPTPSPDGTQVAFLRRVRAENTLWLKDVASGAEWQVASGLDRDMQETWAIHGVYPAMAWTPDSRSIVHWSGGEIRRLDAASGEVATIPFHVADTRTVYDAVRYPVEVHPERFQARMLRWVQVSPDGGSAVFEALGKLWIVDLPDGTPRRLTSQDDHREAFPSFSRDGSEIVYVSWDDDELGAVRVVAARAGAASEGRKVTAEPGHYAQPAISPDGEWVVYRKRQGGFLLSPTWSEEPGLYRVPAAGGEALKLGDGGQDPHFGAGSDRVFFLAFGAPADDGPKRVLKSIGIDGREERTHAVSLNGSGYRVSPDGRWLAWQELFQAYVAPFVATGRTVDVGPKSQALPVANVSADAGDFLSWSGDSSTLHWSLGPTLYSRPLTEAFAFLDGAALDDEGELADEPAAGTEIVLTVDSDQPRGALALVGGRVITMRGGEDEVIEDGVVVIEGNRIAAVGPRSEVDVPSQARVVDVAGKTLMPGLVDVHWHGAAGQGDLVPEENWMGYASLAYGVTTIHDPSNDTGEIFATAELARAGEIVAPRTFSTGTILYGASGSFKAVVDSLDDARSHLARMKAVGAFSVKSYNQPRRDQRQQVLTAARELEMMVVPEGGSLLTHNLNMVVDGHTGIEHAVPAARLYADVHQLWGATGVGYTPTLVVGYGGIWGENYWYATTNVWEDERLLAFVPREMVDARSRRRTTAPEEEWGHFSLAREAKRLLDAGVRVQIGAHGQREGLAAHWETWMLEQGGMTAHEALRAATLDGARYLGLDGDVGSLEAGKLADVLVLDANPLEDVRNSRTVRYVVLNGRMYDAETMNQLSPDPTERAPFWFQKDARDFAALGE